MRKTRGPAIAALALALICFAAAADMVVVKIQTTQLRKSPQFFAPVVAALKAGDRLTKVSESGGWVQVKTVAGLTGWVHQSAVEVPRTNLLAMAGGTRTQATASEAALAGKGFSKQVEDGYKAKHAEVTFVWVDRMVQIKVSLAAVQEFLKVGKLGGSTGGAK